MTKKKTKTEEATLHTIEVEPDENLAEIKNRKLQKFEAELNALSQKHRVRLVPVMILSQQGAQGIIKAELVE